MSMRRQVNWTVMRSMAVMLCACASARAGEIRIWPTSVVEGESIRLGDIAQVNGFDAATAERLTSTAISASPKMGGELLLQSAEVRGALGDAKINLTEVNILGSSRCKVTRPRPMASTVRIEAQGTGRKAVWRPQRSEASKEASVQSVIAKANLETAMREYIAARVGDKDGKVEVRFSPTARRELQTEAAGHRFDIRQREEGKLGLLTFEVEITSSEEAPRKVPIIAEVSLVREVVVAKRPINRGEAIEGRQLKLEERRFTDYSQIGVTDLAAVVGQMSKQLIRPGEMLMERGVESRPVVRRGDAVTIWMRQGGMIIKASGRAQASASLGDRIEVARDGTMRKKDLIEAVVTGPGTVTVGDAPRVALAGGE